MAKVQGDEELLKRVYLQAMRMTASVNLPIYIALGLFAPVIVNLLLGAQWHDAIPLLQIFAVWALLRSTGNPVGSLLMARGRADLSFKWNMVWLLIMPPAIWFGSQYGVMGMAVAMTALGFIGYWPNWYFLVRPLCGAKLGEYSVQIAVPLVLSLLGGIVGYLSIYALVGDFLRLIVGVSIGGVVYLGLSWRFNRVWVDAMLELVGMASKVNLESGINR
jgi:O-antigen/teichoic acid export membrane protein